MFSAETCALTAIRVTQVSCARVVEGQSGNARSNWHAHAAKPRSGGAGARFLANWMQGTKNRNVINELVKHVYLVKKSQSCNARSNCRWGLIAAAMGYAYSRCNDRYEPLIRASNQDAQVPYIALKLTKYFKRSIQVMSLYFLNSLPMSGSRDSKLSGDMLTLSLCE